MARIWSVLLGHNLRPSQGRGISYGESSELNAHRFPPLSRENSEPRIIHGLHSVVSYRTEQAFWKVGLPSAQLAESSFLFPCLCVLTKLEVIVWRVASCVYTGLASTWPPPLTKEIRYAQDCLGRSVDRPTAFLPAVGLLGIKSLSADPLLEAFCSL